jgi:hypothetical protein
MERIGCTHPGHGPARLTTPRPAKAALRGSIVGRGYALGHCAAPGFFVAATCTAVQVSDTTMPIAVPKLINKTHCTTSKYDHAYSIIF